MRSLVFAFILALALPGAAPAQVEPEFSIDATLTCLESAGDPGARQSCIGSGAIACMESHSAGYSTLGQGYCLNSELEYWDARLNQVYRALRDQERQEDIESAAANYPGIVSQAETLQAMQRAWIPYRDARCEYERAQWTGGSGGGPAQVGCLMYLTAEQTLYLEAMRESY